jgi:hypothetical protein
LKLRTLTTSGTEAFQLWLQERSAGALPPDELLTGEGLTERSIDVEVDLARSFANRFEFGQYMTDLLGKQNVRSLLSHEHDGMWNWITVAYFGQFGKKVSKPWHYVVTRRGHSGSLAYRHLARTSFEMFWRHRQDSLVMLNVDMATWGDMSEQLTSRQDVAYHHGYVRTATALYMENGQLRRGAASRVPPASKRRPGDKRGRGAAARLALAVRRLCRTYDTHTLETGQMIGLLPREFAPFAAAAQLSA